MNGKKHITEVYGVVTWEQASGAYKAFLEKIGPENNDELLDVVSRAAFAIELDGRSFEEIHNAANGGESPYAFDGWQSRLSTMQTGRDGVRL